MAGFSPSNFIEKILNTKLQKEPEILDGLDCVYQLTVGDQTWHLDLTSGEGQNIVAGPASCKPDCSLELAPENFEKLTKGKLNIPLAVITGKIKVRGDKKLAMNLVELFK